MRVNRPLFLVIFSALVAGGHAADQTPLLGEHPTHLIEAYQASIEKVVAHARQEIAKQRDQLIADLQVEKQAQTTAGNLPAALAIKAKIESLSSGRDSDALDDPQINLLKGAASEAFADAHNSLAHDAADADAKRLPLLTEAEWEALGGLSFTVDAQAVTGLFDTGIVLKSGESLLVVPNAADKWRCGTAPGDNAPMTFEGDIARDPHGSFRWGCLYVQIGTGIMLPGVVTGSGRLLLKCNDGTTADNSGVIRVKILKVTP